MSVKLIYKDVAVGAAEDAKMNAVGGDEFSALALLPFGSGSAKSYASMEHNMWLLNGTKRVYDGAAYSFWSKEISNEEGYFSTVPEITAKMDEKYNSLGVFLDFGGMNYCSEVEILWYSDSTLLSQKTFYPTALQYFCENRVESYNKVVVRLIRTQHPQRRARLDMIVFGISRNFERDELRGVSVTQQISLISKEMCENVLDWQLNSAAVVDYLFQLKQPVYAYDGEELIGAFYVKSSSRTAPRVYSITCTDAIGVLDGEMFPDAFYSGKNALELAREICGTFDVEMDASLQTKTLRGVLSRKTRRQALQQLCFALGAAADTGGTDKIRIFVPAMGAAKEIPASRVRVGGRVTKSDVVTEVQLTSHSYSTSGSGNAVDINGTKYYDTPTVHTIRNPNATAADKQNVISITDATLISSDNVQTVLQGVFDFYMQRNTHAVAFRLEGERMGDRVSTPTPWADLVTGNITRATIRLSGIAVADAEVIGT